MNIGQPVTSTIVPDGVLGHTSSTSNTPSPSESTSVIVIDTVATLLSSIPSFILKVKLSFPK